MFFHGIPSGNNFTVVTNLRRTVRCVERLRFRSRSVRCLGDGNVFSRRFLRCLEGFGFDNSICTVPRKAPVFPGRPIVAVGTPTVRTRLIRAFLLLAVGRRALVTAGTGEVIHTTRNETMLRFNSHHTRNTGTTISNTETTCVNNYGNATYALASRLCNIPTNNAVTRS